MKKISPILEPGELVALAQLKNVVLVDASTGPDAKKIYNASHIDGALYVSLDKDLSKLTDDPSLGGRHPLPSIEKFSKLLGRLGISGDSHVVVYDNKNGANAAARFWWMLRAAGHSDVKVLNGGIEHAVAAGFPVGASAEAALPVAPYPFTAWQLPIVTLTDVEAAAENTEYIVVDVREKIRYDGIKEPIDLVAGHIPGAINIPFTENLDSSGRFLPPEILYEKYKNQLENRNIQNVIVHCGSGVTACHTVLAADYAGLGIPALYVGSWSEWSRNGKPVLVK